MFFIREIHGLLYCKAVLFLSLNQVGLMEIDGTDVFDVNLLGS